MKGCIYEGILFMYSKLLFTCISKTLFKYFILNKTRELPYFVRLFNEQTKFIP